MNSALSYCSTAEAREAAGGGKGVRRKDTACLLPLTGGLRNSPTHGASNRLAGAGGWGPGAQGERE